MTTKQRKASIRLDEHDLELMLTLLESTIGGPAWRRHEREGWRLLAKVEDCATRFAEGCLNGDDHAPVA